MHFPRWNRTADELCVTELAEVVWAVQMSTVEFHPWNTRRADVEKPDEWRIDLDPMPLCDVRATCGGSRTSPTRCSTSSAPPAGPRRPAARGCTSTCGSSPDHGFTDVRRAALAFAREVERRSRRGRPRPGGARTATRATLFVDYNQNARDHTIARAYSVRGNAEGTGLDPDPLGRGRRRRARRLHDRDGARAVRRARRPARRHRRRASFDLDELLEWAERDAGDEECPPRKTGRTPPPPPYYYSFGLRLPASQPGELRRQLRQLVVGVEAAGVGQHPHGRSRRGLAARPAARGLAANAAR